MTNYAIIAGSGRLPSILSKKIDAKVIAFEGQELDGLQADLHVNIGMIGAILEFLRENEIEKLVFAGGIIKPNISEVKTDATGKKLLAKIAMGSLFGKKLVGDNALFGKIIKFLEQQGFAVVGVHELAPELLAGSGDIAGSIKGFEEDVNLGMEAARELGKKDIGQAVIVDNGELLAEETQSGTKDLIGRCSSGVLVKCKKPQQNEKIDLPSIGPDTIEQLKAAGLAGVAVEAGASLILDKELVIEKANEYGIFVAGV